MFPACKDFFLGSGLLRGYCGYPCNNPQYLAVNCEVSKHHHYSSSQRSGSECLQDPLYHLTLGATWCHVYIVVAKKFVWKFFDRFNSMPEGILIIHRVLLHNFVNSHVSVMDDHIYCHVICCYVFKYSVHAQGFMSCHVVILLCDMFVMYNL